MLAGDVDPVLLGRELGSQRDIALPLGDRFPGIRPLVDDGQVVHGAGVLGVDLDDAPVLLDRFLVEALVLVDFAEAHTSLDRRRIEIDGLLVGVHGLIVEALLAVVDLPEAHVNARIHRVEAQSLLVGRHRRIGLAFRRARFPQSNVGVGVEGSKLDRLVVRLDGLVEESTRRRQEEVAERLVGLRIQRIELGRRPVLSRSLPAVAKGLMNDAQGVLRHHEVRIRLDRSRQQIGRALVTLLPAAACCGLAAGEELERAHRLRRSGSLFHARDVAVRERHLQGARVRHDHDGELGEQFAVRNGHRLER